VRLLCQGACAGAAVAAVAAAVFAGDGLLSGLASVKWLGAALLVLVWVTGYTNAFNFMDGINGIAAGQAAVTGLGMAGLALLVGAQPSDPPVLFSAAAAGAAAGFLPHNFPRARMFMGDVGSATLGYWLSAMTIWLAALHGWEFLIPLVLLHANFILDTAVTLGRRIVTGQRWYDAHREHFYQRLIRAGKSHSFVTLWEMGLQVVTLGLMVAYVLTAGWLARGVLAAAVILIWGAFFLYSELEFRKAPARVALPSEAAADPAQAHR
jgi:UDP-N-acetylmuramyl pentapeptide phosphotransferase/UDP-N-acetylglucosamine-1-phosphate transferase